MLELKRLHNDRGRVTGIKVLRAGSRHRFSPRLIQMGRDEGWMTFAEGRITIRGQGGDVRYRVVSAPGYYCLLCTAPQHGQVEARRHILMAHGGIEARQLPKTDPHLKSEFWAIFRAKGLTSPDPENPAGYINRAYYEAVREEGA